MPPDAPARLALSGRVVTMDAVRSVLPHGVVYVEGPRIVAVRPAAAPPPDGFDEVRAVATRGTIFPGLIELHNHLSYNVLRLWRVPRLYTNRSQWGGTAEYRRLVTGPMAVLGRYPGLVPAVVRYVECKCLVAGVTTSQGVALFSNAGVQRYYRGVVRNVEQTGDAELPDATTRIADVEANDARRFLERLQRSTRVLLHLSEGTDEPAREHFLALHLGDGTWAITPQLVGIHAAALTADDFEVLARHGGAMVWSPLSNLLLYGATARVADARRHGVRIGLGADWSPTGSKNLLGELKVARLVSRGLDGLFSDEELVAMVTRDAAAILKWDAALGSVEDGKRADIVVVAGTADDPYATLLDARETAISLVMIDGVPRFGHPAVMEHLGAAGESAGEAVGEALRVSGRPRFLNLASDEADPVVGAISLAAARGRLEDALARLPELARDLESGRVEPSRAALPADRHGATAPTWFLALDELGETGVEMRPRLPFGRSHAPTGPSLAPALVAQPISEIVQPLTLDPLTVADDADFFDTIEAEPNLPDAVRTALRSAYV
jgi:5-methylthioadenosine/S-adenosylhomocysteine deaminase